MFVFLRKILEHIAVLLYKNVSILYKRMKFSFGQVRYGKNLRVIGPFRLRIARNALIRISNNFIAYSGYNSTIDSSRKNVCSVYGGQVLLYMTR